MLTLPNNLPQQLTTFIGREREISEVRRLLAEGRVVTLTGPGGTGKTRLALEVARVARHGDELYPDGVWLVELAAVSEREAVPQELAAVLGVREEPDRNLLATLADYLLPRSLLLVLDNCEHLLSTCAQLANVLLRRAPDLRILSTSRQAFGIDGECVWNVPPMSLPDPTSPLSVEEVSNCEAVRLFVDRVRLRRPDFALSAENLPSIVSLCRRLDGLPLAMELAAARVRVLSVEQILDRLDERFRLLTSPSTATGATGVASEQRHRTLSGLMDWSYDLLPEPERLLFREMSVFSGGCTLEAVQEVCSAGASGDEWETVELITQLADKSLVIVEEQDGSARYRLLETIRQYAWEKLQASGQAVELRTRHLLHYLRLAEESQDELLGENQRKWLGILGGEHDNLRDALIWSRSGGVDPELGLRLAGALVWFWFFRGYLTEGRTELEAALQNAHTAIEVQERPRGGKPPGTQEDLGAYASLLAVGREAQLVEWAKVLTAAGTLAFLQSEYDVARNRLEEGLAIWRRLGDKRGTAFALTFLARVAERQGDPIAKPMGEESVRLFSEIDEKWGLALSLDFLGAVAREEGDEAQAVYLHNRSLELYKELGHRWGVALELSSFGQAAMQRGDYAAARKRLEEAAAIQREVGDRWTLAWTLRSLAAVLRSEGEHGQAKSMYDESLLIFTDLGDKEGVAITAQELLTLSHIVTRPPARHSVDPLSGRESEPEGILRTGLTGREVEVLQLVAEGLTDARIAELLCLSVRTVQAHVRSIYSKVGVSTRSAATRYAVKQGLVGDRLS